MMDVWGIIGCGVILLFLIGWAMEEPGSVLLFLASIGVTLLIGYIIMNVTILRIIVFSFFGLVAAFFIGFGGIAQIGLWLDDKKREREKERQGGK